MYSNPARVLLDNAERTAKPSGSWYGSAQGATEDEKAKEQEYIWEVQQHYLPKLSTSAASDDHVDEWPEVERLSQKERNLESAVQENVIESIYVMNRVRR